MVDIQEKELPNVFKEVKIPEFGFSKRLKSSGIDFHEFEQQFHEKETDDKRLPWEKVRDKAIFNLKHCMEYYSLQDDEDESAEGYKSKEDKQDEYSTKWKNPESLNDDGFLSWRDEDKPIGKLNTWGGRRCVKSKYATTLVQRNAPFHYVLNKELSENKLDSDGNTLILKQPTEEEFPFNFKLKEEVRKKLTNQTNRITKPFKSKRIVFLENGEKIEIDNDCYETRTHTITDDDYKRNSKGKKVVAYKKIIDKKEGDNGFLGFEIDLMVGSYPMFGRIPKMERSKDKKTGKYNFEQAYKKVLDEDTGRMINTPRYLNRTLKYISYKEDGSVDVKNCRYFTEEEMLKTVKSLLNDYEGDKCKEEFTKLMETMSDEDINSNDDNKPQEVSDESDSNSELDSQGSASPTS